MFDHRLILKTLCMLFTSGALFGCATSNSQLELTKPDPGTGPTATLSVRGALNTGSVRFNHVLRLGKDPILRITDTAADLTFAAGRHEVRLTCHIENSLSGSDLPVNFAVSDAETTLAVELTQGQTLCLKAFTTDRSCAALEVTDPTFCERPSP